MVKEKRLYEILNVPTDVDLSGLKKSYRALAKQFHPDKNPSAGDKFKEISMAYEILSDVNKRKMYDSVGEVGLRGGRQNTSTDSDSESENSDDDLLSNQAYSFSSTSFKFFFSSSGMRQGSGTWWSQCSDSEDESDAEVLLMSGSDSDSGVYCQGNWQQENDCGLLTESEPESIHNSSSDSEEDDVDDDDSPQLYHKFKVIIEDHYSGSDSSDSEDSDRNEGFRQKGRPNYYSKRAYEECTTPSRRAKRSRIDSFQHTDHYCESESDLEVTEILQDGSVRVINTDTVSNPNCSVEIIIED